MTSLKAASIRTCSPDRRSVRCSRDGTWKVSSGITPRGSGEYHEMFPTRPPLETSRSFSSGEEDSPAAIHALLDEALKNGAGV